MPLRRDAKLHDEADEPEHDQRDEIPFRRSAADRADTRGYTLRAACAAARLPISAAAPTMAVCAPQNAVATMIT